MQKHYPTFSILFILFLALVSTQSASASVFSASRKTNGGVCTTYENTCATLDHACCNWLPPGYRYGIEQCYDRNDYSCELDVATDEACLCKKGYQCCNNACYNPLIHTCVNDENTSKFGDRVFMLCPLNHQSCNGACYKTDQQYCCHGSNGGFLSSAPCPNPPRI